MSESRYTRFIPPAILILLPVGLVAAALAPGKALFGIDMFQGSLAIRDLVARALGEGGLPVWDSHAMCGFPLLAALQAGALYPLTWPVVFMSVETFWAFTVMVHLALAGLLAYGWLRQGLGAGRWGALAGGLVFLLSGYFALHVYAGHISQISAYPWLAAVLWRTERFVAAPTVRRGLLLSAAVALLFLPGFPHFVLVAGLLAAARVLVHVLGESNGDPAAWKRAAFFALAFGGGLVLAAPQLLPALELIPHTQRVSGNKYEFTTSFSLPPENLITLLAPEFFGNAGAGPEEVPYWGRWVPWEICAFVGISTFFMAALGAGRKGPLRWLWLGGAATALLLALGGYTFFFRIYYTLVPGADFFRVPGRYLSAFVLCLAPLVAAGIDRLMTEEEGFRKTAFRVAVGAAALLAVVAGLRIVGGLAGPASGLWSSIVGQTQSGEGAMAPAYATHPAARAAMFEQAMASLSWAAGLILATGGLFTVVGKGWVPPRVAGWIGMGMMTAELLIFTVPYYRSEDPGGSRWPGGIVETLRKHPEQPFRIVSGAGTHTSDVGRAQRAGLDHVGGYEALTMARYAELFNVLAGAPPESIIVGSPAAGPHPVYDMLGGRVWVFPEPRPGWREFARLGSVRFFEAPGALPRAFIVPRATVAEHRDQRLGILGSPSFNPRQRVVLEKGPVAEGGEGSTRIVSRGPGRYEIEAQVPKGGYLVLSETHYPGWSAQVDGQEVEILRANHFVQAIWLGPGNHQVRFAYRSTYLAPGFALSGLGLIVPLGFLVWKRRKAAS